MFGDNMECKTHVVCANALALAFVKPESVSSFLVCITAATVGSTICDIDSAHKGHCGYIISYSLFTIIGLILLGINHISINNWIFLNSSYLRIIICFLLLLGVCFYGYLKPHRSFLHSFLGTGIMILLCYIALGNIVIPFMIGIFSHILLDLFNKRGLWLLFPIKKKFSLKLCVYNGEINNLLFNIFYVILIIEFIFFDYYLV